MCKDFFNRENFRKMNLKDNYKNLLIGFSIFILTILSIFAFKYFMKQKGKYNVVRITFREGLNIHETADLLQFNGVVNKSDFFESCDSKDLREEFQFLNGESKDKYFSLEGYLFPDTYDFLKNENPISVIRKFLNNFKEKTKNLKIPEEFSLEQIISIASFLESESPLNDGAKISSVIHNRIGTVKNGGKSKFGENGLNYLQLDSTMYYPYRSKEETPANFKSKYNTYEIKGYPPGPVCSPGLKFIIDAVNPEKTDYFYFCNDKNGNTYFAQTYAEHCENLKLAGLR